MKLTECVVDRAAAYYAGGSDLPRDSAVAVTVEIIPNAVFFDFDAAGELIGVEVLADQPANLPR